MKLCKDCKWYREKQPHDSFPSCVNPKDLEQDHVNGGWLPRWKFCKILRGELWPLDVLLRTCGRRARWFEAKEPGDDDSTGPRERV